MLEYEKIRTIIELQSLAWTFPLLAMCVLVLIESYKPLKNTLLKTKENQKCKHSAQMKWFLAGIFIGFLGNSIDNLYWSIPWSSNYLRLEYTKTLQDFGCFPNLIFRQGLTTFSAYCHLRAFTSPLKENVHKSINITFWISVLFGQGFILLLSEVR